MTNISYGRLLWSKRRFYWRGFAGLGRLKYKYLDLSRNRSAEVLDAGEVFNIHLSSTFDYNVFSRWSLGANFTVDLNRETVLPFMGGTIKYRPSTAAENEKRRERRNARNKNRAEDRDPTPKYKRGTFYVNRLSVSLGIANVDFKVDPNEGYRSGGLFDGTGDFQGSFIGFDFSLGYRKNLIMFNVSTHAEFLGQGVGQYDLLYGRLFPIEETTFFELYAGPTYSSQEEGKYDDKLGFAVRPQIIKKLGPVDLGLVLRVGFDENANTQAVFISAGYNFR